MPEAQIILHVTHRHSVLIMAGYFRLKVLFKTEHKKWSSRLGHTVTYLATSPVLLGMLISENKIYKRNYHRPSLHNAGFDS